MSTTKYDEDFKKSLVTLYQNGKTQAQLCREYGVSESALCKWVKQYATVQTDDGEVLTAKQQAFHSRVSERLCKRFSHILP